MGRIFDLDSPLMRGLGKMADVMWVNILTLLFALPLLAEMVFFLSPVYYGLTGTENFELESYVGMILIAWGVGIIASIPLGPALTAMHYVLLKLFRNEESYVTKGFFKSFKENFRQSAVLQVLQFLAGGILLFDFILVRGTNNILKYVLFAVTLLLYMATRYIFPLQAKFENSILGTIKNAFLMSILALPRTVAMTIVCLLPWLLFYFFDLRLLPILFLFGYAGPGFMCAALYSDTFKKFEPKEEELSEEDELDNAIRKIDEEQ